MQLLITNLNILDVIKDDNEMASIVIRCYPILIVQVLAKFSLLLLILSDLKTGLDPKRKIGDLVD